MEHIKFIHAQLRLTQKKSGLLYDPRDAASTAEYRKVFTSCVSVSLFVVSN
jgi:hypothetical protein